MLIVITPALIGRGDRVQQQIIWEWENPRCDRDRLQSHQVGKGNNTCTLMRAPHIFDFVYSEKKKTKYVKSELRLIETLDGICDRILAYNIHKVFGRPCHQLIRNIFPSFQERKDSTRFAKGQSETFSTLEGLVAKGVKVSPNFPIIGWNWKLIRNL